MNRREILVAICAAPIMIEEAVKGAMAGEKPAETLKFVVPFMRADVVNSNKRLYPRHVLEQAVARLDDMRLQGHVGMPNDSLIHFQSLSHEVKDIGFRKVEGHEWLCGELKVLPTPSGKLLQQMLDADPKSVAFRTCGVGMGKMNEDGVLVIDDSYKFASVNAVSAEEATKWS